MSTRSTIHFTDDGKTPDAIIYRHSDGYPSVGGADILKFFAEVGKLGDPRFNDPSYLAARFVVFLARLFNVTYAIDGPVPNESPYDFLSVGVVMEDPGDIEFRYVVTCSRDGKPPTVEVFEVSGEHSDSLGDLPKVLKDEELAAEDDDPDC